MWEFWRGKLGSSRSSRSSQSRTSAAERRNGAGSGDDRGGGGPAQRRSAAVVNFKDLNLSVDDELSEDATAEAGYHPGEDEDPTNKFAIIRTKSLRSGAQRNKLIIVMVGLPGRGKTFLCNKLKCYLNWLGHNTAHFNVGNYRRLQKGANEVQDAQFFDAQNRHGVEARSRALMAAIDDVMRYLAEAGQVAIFDATNTTKERRQLLINMFHGRNQYIFIESICNDSQVLEDNYRYKMKYSPDYQGVDTEAALADFKHRIAKYNEVYEPIDDPRLHYIKLIDMVTGRGYMGVNRISGYIPGKIVFFLMQVCKAGMHAGQSRKIWLTRHGESQFNQAQRIGGDSGLTPRGEEYARLLPDVLESRLPATFNESGVPVSVWTSTLRRTIATANFLPYPKLRWKALDEIHAGVCDGMTYEQIAAKFPEDYEARKRDKLRYRYPSGESYFDVIQRLEPVIIEMEREREYIAVVGHQAVLRAIFGYFMAVPLDTIPRLDIPLHTLIELQPRADGTMEVSFLPVPVPIYGGPSLSLPAPGGGSGTPTKHGREHAAHHQPHGSSPPGLSGFGAALGALSGLKPLSSSNSLPSGFFGVRGSPRSSRSSREAAHAAAAAGLPGAGVTAWSGSHRRTASGTAVPPLAGQYSVTGQYATASAIPFCQSFATVSSMGSFGGAHSSSQGSLSGGTPRAGQQQQQQQEGGFASSLRSRSSNTALSGARGEQQHGDPGAGTSSTAAAAGVGAAGAAAQFLTVTPRTSMGDEQASDAGLNPWGEQHPHQQGAGGSSSSSRLAASSQQQQQQPHDVGAELAAELNRQGLALHESVALTSAAGIDVADAGGRSISPTAAAAAAAPVAAPVAGGSSDGSLGDVGSLREGSAAWSDQGSSGSGGSVQFLAPVVTSMNSLD